MSVSANCHFIERLFFESSKTGVVSPSLGCVLIMLSQKKKNSDYHVFLFKRQAGMTV